MSERLPSSIYTSQIPGKGRGLFTSKEIDAGGSVFLVDRPLARYHKYECKILGQLSPKIAPSLVRVVMQLLLRRKANALSDSEWGDFLGLLDHSDDLKKDSSKGGIAHDRWQDVQLMSQAAHRYSGTTESPNLVLSMMARPDVPTTSKKGPSSAKMLEIEAEGERLQASVENATSVEKLKLLDQAMSLFVSYKDIFPIWRYPWPSIRDELRLLHWSLDNWSIATVHALKEYFFIEPVLYPVPWHPIRIQRLFVLLKLIYELQYQVFASDDNEVEGDLKSYYINWLSVNKGLEQEIEAAIPKAFGTDSSFAEEYKRLPKSEPPEHYGLRMDWPGERAKLRKAAEEIAD
ncbi:MAG: hypothetical protein Q9209_005105 [Squamulea sp. 1 TL-2023]